MVFIPPSKISLALATFSSLVTNGEKNFKMAEIKETCTLLAQVLPEKVTFPGDVNYMVTEDQYFSAQEQEIKPACIVAPTSTEDVATIIKSLASRDVQFAVRGGGHTLNAGAANIASGVTINLRRMKHVSVNANKTLVSVGGGAKWGEVYSYLDTMGLATSGGRVSDVGVGGLSTGGGISFFSGREGLVCDNIENYEVVLSDGRTVNANRNENHDLWIALKGGSNNFGVVTRFDLPTFTQGKFYGGVIVSPITTLESQLQGFANLMANFDPYAALIMSVSWNQTRQSYAVFCNIQYTKEEENPPSLQPFTQVQPQYLNTMRISNLTDFATETGKYSTPGIRNQFATTTFGASLSLIQTVHQIWNDSISGISSIQGTNWAMVIQPFPSSFSKETAELGGNSLGLSPSDGPLVLFLLSYSWDKKEDDAAITAAAQKLIADIDAAAASVGLHSNFKYLNYAAYWQKPISGYGEASMQNLKKVSAKYDPTGVFQKQCPGGFKLSTS